MDDIIVYLIVYIVKTQIAAAKASLRLIKSFIIGKSYFVVKAISYVIYPSVLSVLKVFLVNALQKIIRKLHPGGLTAGTFDCKYRFL